MRERIREFGEVEWEAGGGREERGKVWEERLGEGGRRDWERESETERVGGEGGREERGIGKRKTVREREEEEGLGEGEGWIRRGRRTIGLSMSWPRHLGHDLQAKTLEVLFSFCPFVVGGEGEREEEEG